MVGVDAGRPGFLKRVELKLGVLVGGADPRVSDDGQPLLLSHNPVVIRVLILPGYETGFQDNVIAPLSLEARVPTNETVAVASNDRFRYNCSGRVQEMGE